MAAPPEKTLKNLTGKYQLNKELSDSIEPVLVVQGIGFFIRKAIGVASISLDVNQYEAPPNPPSTSTDIVTHIDIEQSASGLSSTHEKRCLDNVFREHKDWLFGEVQGKTRWVTADEVTDEHLKKGWEEGGDGQYLQSYVESKTNGWTAEQIWGFQVVDGKRRYCRNIVVLKGSDRAAVRLVYDYLD